MIIRRTESHRFHTAPDPTPHPDRGSKPDPTPWDRVIGLRVGAVAGGLLGAVVVLVTGIGNVGIIAGPALLGGLIGWLSQRRRAEP